MKVTRPVVQMTFTQVNCETEMFAPFFCRIIHRMMSTPEGDAEGICTDEDLVRETDKQFLSGTVDTSDPEAVVATVHRADIAGAGYGVSRFPVQFVDVLHSQEDFLALVAEGTERLVLDPEEPDPDTPVVVVVDDSRCGWVQAERWAEDYGAIILWWAMVADQFVGLAREATRSTSDISRLGFEMWDRGRRVGYRHGFSEGFYQAKKEAEAKNKKTGK